MEDPMSYMNKLSQTKQELVLRKASLPLEMVRRGATSVFVFRGSNSVLLVGCLQQEETGKEEFEILLSDDGGMLVFSLFCVADLLSFKLVMTFIYLLFFPRR